MGGTIHPLGRRC